MSDLDDLALFGVACPFCGVEPGEWCVTARPYSRPAGRRTSWLHAARTDLLREAWKIGWDDGQGMAYGLIATRLEAALAGSFWARDMPTDPEGIVRWLRAAEALARG